MESAKNITLVALAVLAAALVMPVSRASAQDDAWRTWEPEREISGVRVHIDNDLFAGRDLDRDYTGGMSITLSGAAARDNRVSLNPLLVRLDGLFESEAAPSIRHAQQVGLIAFTPGDIVSREVQQDDRPYASLLFLS